MSSQTPSPSPTDTGTVATDTSVTQPDQTDSESSTLYLYTFLATVFFLLLISSSIVFRSYILRRRLRRRYENALANGILTELDGTTLAGVARGYGIDGGFGRARKLGAKPLLWETWVDRNGSVFGEGTKKCTHTYPDEKHSRRSSQRGTNDAPEGLNINSWTDIMPVALHIIRSSPSPSSPSSPGSPDTQQHQLHTLLSRLRLRNPGSRSSRPSSSECASNDTDLVGSDSGRDADPKDINAFSGSKADTLSVSVLIAMPDVSAPARRPSMHASREGHEEGGKGKGIPDSHSHSPTHPHQQQQNHPQAPSRSSPPHGPIPNASEDAVRGLPFVEFGVAEVEAIGLGEVIR